MNAMIDKTVTAAIIYAQASSLLEKLKEIKKSERNGGNGNRISILDLLKLKRDANGLLNALIKAEEDLYEIASVS